MDTVLVTGCSSGFGLLTAVAFARRGDRVVATMRNPAKADALREAAKDAGVEVEVAQLDVTDDASVRRAVAEVGDVDVLVNNAGVGGTAGPIEELTDEQWLAVLDANLLGCVRTSRAVLPGMRARGRGAIVNVSSLAGRLPGTPVTSAYAASKHAVCSFSDSLWGEVEPFGIRVACVEPGFFATAIVDNSAFGVTDPGSPYAGLTRAVERFYESSVGGGADPQAVADDILDAVHGEPRDTIHRPVGADAELFIAGYRSMSYADYRAVGRQSMGIA